jgi:hypothetical protein
MKTEYIPKTYGGTLEAGPLQTAGKAGFRLLVNLPLPSQMTSGKERG